MPTAGKVLYHRVHRVTRGKGHVPRVGICPMGGLDLIYLFVRERLHVLSKLAPALLSFHHRGC